MISARFRNCTAAENGQLELVGGRKKENTAFSFDLSCVDMDMWLTVVDSQFVTHGIAQELTKFHYVVGALTPDLADRLRHIICNPPQ